MAKNQRDGAASRPWSACCSRCEQLIPTTAVEVSLDTITPPSSHLIAAFLLQGYYFYYFLHVAEKGFEALLLLGCVS